MPIWVRGIACELRRDASGMDVVFPLDPLDQEKLLEIPEKEEKPKKTKKKFYSKAFKPNF